MIRKTRSLWFAFVMLTGASSQALSYGALYAVGDSLSDVGNALIALGGLTGAPPYVTPIPSRPYAYAGGRFSNGEVWVEHLADGLGLSLFPSLIPGGTGSAFGGARTGVLTGITLPPGSPPTLQQQAQLLVAALATLPGNGLYVVWGGGNDVRDAGERLAVNDIGGAEAVVADAVTNIAGTIATLSAAGARHFLVPNLPNLGLVPAVQALGQPAVNGMALLTGAFNTALGGALAALNASPDIHVIGLDVFGFMNAVFADPAGHGFTNVSGACALEHGGRGCADPDAYVFWDGIHPSRAAHALLGDAALAAVIPLPAPVILLLSALAGLGCMGRRLPPQRTTATPAGGAGHVLSPR